jgi:chondroitin AC lyase
VQLLSGPKSGSWYHANHRYPDREETRDVFTLWIDHGERPQQASYAYTVIPNVELDHFDKHLASREYRVLTNTVDIQAVEHRELGLVCAAFYEPGKLMIDTQTSIEVDRPCLVLLRRVSAGKWKITAADPRHQSGTLMLSLNSATPAAEKAIVPISMPTGHDAGGSVTVEAKTPQHGTENPSKVHAGD